MCPVPTAIESVKSPTIANIVGSRFKSDSEDGDSFVGWVDVLGQQLDHPARWWSLTPTAADSGSDS